MKFKAFVAGIAGSFVLASSAMAADIPVIVPPAPPPIVVPAGPAAFDWSGVYAGVIAFPPAPFVVGQVGYNFVRGNFLVGASVGLGVGAFMGPTLFLHTQARAGLLIGERDRVLVFGEALYQRVLGLGGGIGLGGGAEVKVTDRLSVFGTVGYGGGCCYFTTGVNFAFGG